MFVHIKVILDNSAPPPTPRAGIHFFYILAYPQDYEQSI